jgi:hypothetical protein
MVPVLWADVLLPLFCVLVRGRAHSLTRGGTGEADNRTVLEPTGKFSLSCSPPIPSFPPIREVLAHGEAAARERDDHGNCAGRKGAVCEDAHREVPRYPVGG